MVKLSEFLPLKIAHVFLNRRNSLRSNSLRFHTENLTESWLHLCIAQASLALRSVCTSFPDFLNATETYVSFTHHNSLLSIILRINIPSAKPMLLRLWWARSSDAACRPAIRSSCPVARIPCTCRLYSPRPKPCPG